MSIARKWVFPIIRIVIFAVIAVALVKIAFLSDASTGTQGARPTAEIVEPQIAVTVGTIQNNVIVQGTVSGDQPTVIKATLSGQVREVLVKQGQQVSVGTEIVKLKAEVTNPDDTTSVDYEIVTSPVAGVLTKFSALAGQTFAVGDDVGEVAPSTFSVSGPISPEQQYRLTNQPTEAQVTITGGPAPFTCTGLTISSLAAGSEEPQATPTSPTVRCSVPPEVRVFAGLSAELTLAGGVATDVLTVPVTAVEGSAQKGNVFFVLPDGSTEPRSVTLGINDGITVHIIDGLVEGDQILQFVPGALAVDGAGSQECIDDGSAEEFCE
ncbi:MAG: efflux RND transporter periplasmic adaptor subunit [Rhodoglobus sp.]